VVVKGKLVLLAGLHDPGLQFQFTPAPPLLKSLATVAVSMVLPFTCNESFVAATLTLIGGGGPTVMAPLPLLVESAFDWAVTVTGSVAAPAGSDCGVV
jgi:hypothetical protein